MSSFDYDFETKAVNFSCGTPQESGDVHRPCSVDLEITCSAHFLLVKPHETDPRRKKPVASVSLKISNSVCIKPHQSETSKILLGIVETWPLHPGEQRTKLLNRIHSLLKRYTYAKKTCVSATVNFEIINTHLLHESSVFHRILALAPERRRIEGEEEEEEEITDRCSICLNDFSKGNQVSIMPCSHMFHCNCIEQWLIKRPSCPLCRFQMTMGVIYKCPSHLDLDPYVFSFA